MKVEKLSDARGFIVAHGSAKPATGVAATETTFFQFHLLSHSSAAWSISAFHNLDRPANSPILEKPCAVYCYSLSSLRSSL